MRMSHSDRSKANLRISGEQRDCYRPLGRRWSGAMHVSHSDRSKANLRISGEQRDCYRPLGRRWKKSAARVVLRSHVSL